MTDRVPNWPSKVSGVWLDEIQPPGTVRARSPVAIREVGKWMREHEPDMAEVLTPLAKAFGVEEASYSGPKQDELRAHMEQWRDLRFKA